MEKFRKEKKEKEELEEQDSIEDRFLKIMNRR